MKIVNIQFSRVGIDPTTSGVYTHTLVPLCRRDWSGLDSNYTESFREIKIQYAKRIKTKNLFKEYRYLSFPLADIGRIPPNCTSASKVTLEIDITLKREPHNACYIFY